MTQRNGVCRDCGRNIVWVRQPSGSWHPPLDYLSNRLVITPDGVSDEPTFGLHVCDEDDVASWEVHTSEQENIRRDIETRRLMAIEASRSLPCTKCEAAAGEGCWNLTARRKGEDKHTAWPHPERLEAAGWKPL